MMASDYSAFGSYSAWMAKEGTWFISFMNGRQFIYLLEGKEHALLIDTGYGTGTLRDFVSNLTRKPLIVVNTHFHRDHAGGNGEFPEVCLSPGYVIDEPEWIHHTQFDLSKLPYPDYQKTILAAGQVIDLGGRIIEVMDVLPAHCNSSLFFLDCTERMFFCGDEIDPRQVLMYIHTLHHVGSVSTNQRLLNFRQNTEKILSHSAAFDWLLPCHNGTPVSKSYLYDFIALVDRFFSGEALIEKDLHHPVISKLPLSSQISRVSFQGASFFMANEDIQALYGKREY